MASTTGASCACSFDSFTKSHEWPDASCASIALKRSKTRSSLACGIIAQGLAGTPRAQIDRRASLLRRFEGVAVGFDLGGFFLAQLDDVLDERLIVELINRLAVEVDHAGACPAAGKADIGLACFAGPVHHAADDGERHRRGGVHQAVLPEPQRLDDV